MRSDRVPSPWPPSAPRSRRACLRLGLLGLGAGLVAGPGCVPLVSDLVVATDWSIAECRALAMRLAPLRIGWVRAAGGADPTQLVATSGIGPGRIDAILGGPADVYAVLEAAGRLEPGAIVARRSLLGFARRPEPEPGVVTGWDELGTADWQDAVALGDPRDDAATLGGARAHLESFDWSDGYADLVRAAGRALPIGRGAEAALAPLVEGRARIAPGFSTRTQAEPGLLFSTLTLTGERPEGAAIVRGARNLDAARRFLTLIGELVVRNEPDAARDGPTPVQAVARPESERTAEALLADLLGAVLVDAQPELRAALRTLDTTTHPDAARAAAWLVVPPPWPPASITQLQRSPQTAPLATDLARQLVPDGQARAWLLASWDQAPAPIQGTTLMALAQAVGGSLAAEPRFRAWLRSEWLAWARQRFRRVTRMAQGLEPLSTPASDTEPAPASGPVEAPAAAPDVEGEPS